MNITDLYTIYTDIKEQGLFGRYITNSNIEKCLDKLPKALIETIGHSVEKRPIYKLQFGTGPKKVLMWSQMHGNESTTTKALFDCVNLFQTQNEFSKKLLESCTIVMVPILNPDGAERYTRANAKEVDLNRDAQALSQPESNVLRGLYNEFKPQYCFNLHGQRTIFGAGSTGVSATMSFLSPAEDENRSLTENRKVAMTIISDINNVLKDLIPNGIGRYDDGFNLNCVGDTFQSFGVPTLLYETGHYPNDYDREEVRKLAFIAILKGIESIIDGVDSDKYEDYFKIPENTKTFYDIIIRNARLNDGEEHFDVAIQYKESLKNGKIDFIPVVESISDLNTYYGHKEIDAKGDFVKNAENLELKVGYENVFVLINNEKTSLKA